MCFFVSVNAQASPETWLISDLISVSDNFLEEIVWSEYEIQKYL
jgi:hypothetical protein